MAIYRYDIIQNTPEWEKIRLGIPTASSAAKLVTPDGKVSDQIKTYSKILALEKLGARESFSTKWTDRGHELESEALLWYDMEISPVRVCGFVTTDDGQFGYSPDGLVVGGGLLDVKCPSLGVYAKYAEIWPKYPKEWIPQIQSGMMVTNDQWFDLMVYYPDLKPLIWRFNQNKDFISLLKRQSSECIRLRDEFIQHYDKIIVGKTETDF